MTIPDYFVRVIELPRAVRGVTVPNDDGTFSVYINSLYDDGIQRETLEHELAHLARDHFYKAGSIAVQEAEASGRTGVGTASAERSMLSSSTAVLLRSMAYSPDSCRPCLR